MAAEFKPSRPETGYVKFGEDWRAVFIRGDVAFFYAHQLLGHIAALDALGAPMASSTGVTYLRQLGELLRNVDEREPAEVQRLRPFTECVVDPAKPTPLDG